MKDVFQVPMKKGSVHNLGQSQYKVKEKAAYKLRQLKTILKCAWMHEL